MDTYLLLSNPPHSGPDVNELSQMFGLSIVEAEAKLAVTVPEIWFANSDSGPLKQMSSTLDSMGLNTRVVNGNILGMTPAVDKLITFGFMDAGLECTTVGGVSFVAPYDTHTVLAMIRPGEGGQDDARITQSGSLATMAGILDMYFVMGGRIRRVTVNPQTTDFAGLDKGERETSQENYAQMIEQMKNRFSDIVVDERLVDVPVPRQQMIGSGGSLKGILKAINPELFEITPTDLQSRLAFLSSV